jgi:hypothetical protein
METVKDQIQLDFNVLAFQLLDGFYKAEVVDQSRSHH